MKRRRREWTEEEEREVREMGEGRYRGEERIIEIKKRKIESQKIKRKKTGAVNFFLFLFLFYYFQLNN